MGVPRTLAKGLSKLKEAAELRKLGGTQAERMARAAEQGYRIARGENWYHGTNKDVTEFKDGMTFLASQPRMANEFAQYRRTYEGGNVMPLSVKGNYLEVDGGGRDIRSVENGTTRLKESFHDMNYSQTIYDYAKDAGYDGVKFRNVTDEVPSSPNYPASSDVLAIFDPSNIRSVNADFNPEYRDSPNLLAGIAGAMPYAGATAALLAGATGSQEAEAGTLQSLGRAAPYLTSAALGGAAALQSGDAEAGVDDLLRRLPGRNEFNYWLEQGDEAIEAGRNATGAPVVVLDKLYIDPQNRGKGVAREVMRQGIDEMAQKYPGMEVQLLAEPLDDATNLDDLVRLYESSGFSVGNYQDGMSGVPMDMRLPKAKQGGNATPALLAATAVGTAAGMAVGPQDAEAGMIDALGRAAPYLATGALGAAMMTPQDTQAYNDYIRDEMEARTAADKFAQMRGSKAGYWEARRQELLDMVNGLGEMANNVVLPALDKPLQGYLGLAGTAGALAQGQGLQQALMQGANIARQPSDQTTYNMGGAVTDTLSPYTTPEAAAAAGALTNAGIQMLSPI